MLSGTDALRVVVGRTLPFPIGPQPSRRAGKAGRHEEDPMPVHYSVALPNPALARGNDPALSFNANGAAGFAEQLQDALRSPALFERWRASQPDPDQVDPEMGAVDPDAVVSGQQQDLRINLVATTRLPGDIFNHRMRLLAGNHWELRDVR